MNKYTKARWIAWNRSDGKCSKIHASQPGNPFRTLCGHTNRNAEVIECGPLTIDAIFELFCCACIYLHFSGAAAYYRAAAKNRGKIPVKVEE